jgi:hypothetical protein
MSLMEVPDTGSTKQAAEIKDASGKITIGLWKFQIPNKENHPSFQVDVKIGPGEGWVCIGGGAIGSALDGNFFNHVSSFARRQWQ